MGHFWVASLYFRSKGVVGQWARCTLFTHNGSYDRAPTIDRLLLQSMYTTKGTLCFCVAVRKAEHGGEKAGGPAYVLVSETWSRPAPEKYTTAHAAKRQRCKISHERIVLAFLTRVAPRNRPRSAGGEKVYTFLSVAGRDVGSRCCR